MDIAVDLNKNLVYEGSGSWGHPIWPSPIILPAVFISPSSENLEPEDSRPDPFGYVFREVGFDAVTRVRRGYFYHANRSSQPAEWHVAPHPAINQENRELNRHGVVTKSLHSYGQFSLKVTFREFDGQVPLVVLGTSKSFTLWNILSFETDATGNELVALKSRLSYGALPNLIKDAIPKEHAESVIAEITTLQDDIFKAGPISIVDRCREAATSILSAYCQHIGITNAGLEAGKLIRAIRELPTDQRRDVAANLVDTIRIFHTRGKSSVRERMDLRAIVEQDAELAVQAVGVILCDLGWARW